MKQLRNRLLFAFCFAATVSLVSWLSGSPYSPIASSLGGLGSLFETFQIGCTILAFMLSGNVHGGGHAETIYWALVFGQWFAVCFVLASLACLETHKSRS